MHPIAFRVHTHRHGEKVSGWVVSEDEIGNDQWSLLGERSPQNPQIFEEVKNSSMVIKQGQVLASRCSIKNNEDHKIEIGPTSEDEM
jgi:peptidylglycine monooxygenase